MPKNLKFILVIALQVCIIVGVALYKYSITANGTEVVLNIKPVDPRDILRGDYVTFQYDISDISSYMSGSEDIKNGMTVYVTLEKYGSKSWNVTKMSTKKPSEENVFIKGVVQSGGKEYNQAIGVKDKYDHIYHITYGIEQYFIAEGAGRNFSFARKDVKAMVSIDKNGNAVIKAINVDGKRWP